MRSLVSLVREAIKAVKKNPFKTDLRTTGGEDRPGGYSKTYHSDDGTYSGSGSGYTTQGSKGWARSGEEFEQPETSIPLDRSDIDEVEELWKDPLVGSQSVVFNANPGNKNKVFVLRKK